MKIKSVLFKDNSLLLDVRFDNGSWNHVTCPNFLARLFINGSEVNPEHSKTFAEAMELGKCLDVQCEVSPVVAMDFVVNGTPVSIEIPIESDAVMELCQLLSEN